MKATHKDITEIVGYQAVNLNVGEFVFGRKKAAKECGLTERNVRTCLKSLKSAQQLTIKVTNKFSIISIINWDVYQQDINQNDQQNASNLTNKRPASDQQVTTNKHIKNIKNKEREGFTFPDWIEENTWQDFKEFRIRIKAPLTARAIKEIVSDLEKLKSAGHEPNAVLLQSIKRGWRGVFEIKDNCYTPKKDEVRSYTPPNRIEELRKKAIEREKYLKGE